MDKVKCIRCNININKKSMTRHVNSGECHKYCIILWDLLRGNP
jgi:uncharacterized C2H2 Zn-finger protein